MAIAPGANPMRANASPSISVEHGSVLIKRDDFGVPNIYADDTRSLFYGWGYAVAEDRLFQIESTRRSALGRAAEVFGPEYLEKDRLTRMNYDPASLDPQLATLKGEIRTALDGMVAGINARVREVLADPKLMPKGFSDFGFEPELWTDRDVVMCWLGHLLFRFSDYTAQISNVTLLEELRQQHGETDALRIFGTLRWRDDPSAPLTVHPEDQKTARSQAAGRTSSASPLPVSMSPDIGEREARESIVLWGGTGPDRTPHSSNSWSVNGAKLADAQSVLVSGPQVGDQVPSMLWEASLHGPGVSVTGLTYPGLLYFHFGTNGDIAWGRTALAGSILDIYREELNPHNPREYRFKGRWRKMKARHERIAVKGRAPEDASFYGTVHGPVILFDEKKGIAYSKRRSWAGHELETIAAYFDEMKARNPDEWFAAVSRKANNQSQYYADRQGNIAYFQAGRYPIRADGHDVHLPTAGTGEREWRGFQPVEQNVRVLNPKSGYIANWNNRPALDVLNTDTLLWSKLDHVDILTAQLDVKPRLTVQEVWDVNRAASHAAEQHSYFVPLIEAAIREAPAGSPLRKIGEVIAQWNGQERDTTLSGFYESPGTTAYYAWMETALTRFFEKDIPARYLNGCRQGYSDLNCPYEQPLGAKVLYFALSEGKTGSVTPGYDFLHGASAPDFIRATLSETAERLIRQYGPDPQTWLLPTQAKVWGTLSPAQVPWSSPDESITYPVEQKRGSMNAIYVFRNGKVTMCSAAPPGQSGFVARDGTPGLHYRDQQQLYTGFSCKRRWVTREEVDAHTVSEKRLEF
jgi:penicillin amidase